MPKGRLRRPLATDAAEWSEIRELRDDPRIDRFLRASSRDELPQLFDVMHGGMSLVGPRPIVHAEVARYGREIDTATPRGPVSRPVAGQRTQRPVPRPSRAA